MESRLRRGAAFCRRMAVGALGIGFVGSVLIGAAFGRGFFGEGLSIEAFLTVMFASILGLLLTLGLFLMIAQTMEGLADLIVGTARLSAATPAPATTRANDAKGNGWHSFSLNGSGPATLTKPMAEAVIGQLVCIKEVAEHIRIGHFVNVTTSDGVTGWIRDTDLPPPLPAPGPRQADGVPYRPLGPSLSPGNPTGQPAGHEGLTPTPAAR